jgi:hypothetical protein
MALLVVAVVLNTVGFLLMFATDRIRTQRHVRESPIAVWLSTSTPVAVGGGLIFLGVVIASFELARR